MKTYRGALPGCTFILNTTLVDFKKAYTDMANSTDKTPTASQLFPHVKDGGACMFRDVVVADGIPVQAMVFDGIIYYETREGNDDTPALPPVVEKKALRMTL